MRLSNNWDCTALAGSSGVFKCVSGTTEEQWQQFCVLEIQGICYSF